MSSSKNKTTYERVVEITHVYLGPAADRFIDRQIENHLHKSPKSLTKNDLNSLTSWIKVIVSLICDDPDIVEEYIHELNRLTITKNNKKGI